MSEEFIEALDITFLASPPKDTEPAFISFKYYLDGHKFGQFWELDTAPLRLRNLNKEFGMTRTELNEALARAEERKSKQV